MRITLSAQMLTSAHTLSKMIGEPRRSAAELPKYNLDGEPIGSVKELANTMGVDLKVAALYAIDRNREELLDEAKVLLTPSLGKKHLSVQQYVDEVTKINPQTKRVRLVRTILGARRFSQPRGSIIVTDGDAPLNNLRVLPNDVRGYDKVTDSKGRIFYIGEEANRWVVRAPGQHQPLFVGDSDKDAYYWLDQAVVGKKPKKAKA